MIVALVALVVALGSSGYAQIVPVITGKNITNNSVTGKDIRDLTRKDIRKRSLRGRKFQLNSVGGRAIKESRLETVPSAASAGGLDLWAVVRGEDGKVLRPPAADDPPSAVRKGLGDYRVTFNRDVHSCSYQATIGSPGVSFPALGQIIVAADSLGPGQPGTPPADPNAVLVRTADKTGAVADRSFQLAVTC